VVAGAVDTATAIAAPIFSSTGIANIHPGFKKNYLIHDIALVRLLTPFTLSCNTYLKLLFLL